MATSWRRVTADRLGQGQVSLLAPGQQELVPGSCCVPLPTTPRRIVHLIGCGRQQLLARSRHDRPAAGGYCRLPAGLPPSPRDAPPILVPPVLRPRPPGLQEQEGYPGKTDGCSLPSL